MDIGSDRRTKEIYKLNELLPVLENPRHPQKLFVAFANVSLPLFGDREAARFEICFVSQPRLNTFSDNHSTSRYSVVLVADGSDIK